MCYTIEKNLSREELEKRFGAGFRPNRPYSPGKRVSAFTLPEVPVIRSNTPESIDVFTWGLIPFWTKSANDASEIRLKTFNAKAETLKDKPSFRHTIKNQRCLVLTNGFYEWQHVGKQKVPYFIQLKSDIAMPMAGLCDNWVNQETGEMLQTFTIVTTKANHLMEVIHNTKKRMPAILLGEAENIWLDQSINEDKALSVLVPLDDYLMKAEKVGENTNGKGIPEQKSLF
ncbi:MAG: SOS response-associated peptidase [Bacteroidales bacterium]|nr:SOS response-associated peptidase [Bacteroidales bacterium]